MTNVTHTEALKAVSTLLDWTNLDTDSAANQAKIAISYIQQSDGMIKHRFEPKEYDSPRPGAHIWKAWADGKTVQIKMNKRGERSSVWVDDDPRNWEAHGPDEAPEKWRVKPTKVQNKSCKFGVLVDFQGNTYFDLATDVAQEKYVEEQSDFYKWLTDWIDFEVEVEDAW